MATKLATKPASKSKTAKAPTKSGQIDKPKNLGNPRMGWASDAIAELLARMDFPYISLVPGASYRGFHDSLVNYLGNSSPRMLVNLHEEHAVAVAHGYSKVTDKPLPVALHSNVGLMHGTMAIFNAWCDRAPMIIFGANGPVDANERRPWIDWIHSTSDMGALIRDYTKWDDAPTSVPAAFESLLRANQIARTAPMGPTYVCLDAGLQEAKLADDVAFPDIARFLPAKPPAPSDEVVARAADWFLKARRPLIMLGRGSRDASAWKRRVRLAELTGAVVLTDMHNCAVFPTNHPNHPIEPRFRPSPRSIEIVRQADVILALDWLDPAGFFAQTLKSNIGDSPDAKIINVTLDSYLHRGWGKEHQALPPADLPVLADPDVFVESFLAEVERRTKGKPKPLAAFKIPPVANRKATLDKSRARGGMNIRDLAEAAVATLRGKTVSYTRLPLGWPSDAIAFNHPLDYLGTDGGGGVGSGPGIAVGCALALMGSGRLPVAIVGDGDFLMGNNALWTAAHNRIPLLMVIANNRSYFNDETHQERMAVVRSRPPENKWIGQRLDDPAVDLSAMARAQGLEGEGPIWDADALKAALKRGIAAVEKGKTYVIDARIDTGYAEPMMTHPGNRKAG
ncbi:MAG TPA: thiamine pyrophosphate-dependent enzyme [Alphaproteobacteria bacterium]|nr:thiamine pyrophosphate-dependent enzyme [Alphaproteobacteria bacterium]